VTIWQMLGGLLGLFLLFAVYETIKNMVSKEAQTRLERLPYAILRVARRRLPPEHREKIHDEEWLPELIAIVRETDGLPITRMIRGVDYAVGLVFAASKVSDLRESAPRPSLAQLANADLLSAVREGDQRAWEALVDKYANLVWSVASSFQLGQSDSADVSQATWLRLVEHLDDIRDVDKVGSWLAATARREAVALLRRQKRLMRDRDKDQDQVG
jgi:hypothetical protein